MNLPLIFLVIAVVCFVLEAFAARINIPIKWWALGVAAYLASLAAA